MIKILAGICFAISLGVFFIKKANQTNLKGYFLNDMINFIAFVKDSVRYTRTDIPTIKQVAVKRFPYLKFLTEGIKNNCYEFGTEIESFMQEIGKSDVIGQVELCDRYYDFFKKIYDKEKYMIEKSVKTYFALGLFSATALLVLFI